MGRREYRNYLVADATKVLGGPCHRGVGRTDKTWISTVQKQTYTIVVSINCGSLPTLWIGFTLFYAARVSPAAALQIAAQLGPFERALNAALPVRSRSTIRRKTINACTVKTQRLKSIRHLKWVSLALRPLRERVAASLPVRTPARKLNIPLIMFLIHHLDYPDKQSPIDWAKGMDIVDNIPPSRALTQRDMTPATNMECLKTNLVARNRTILRNPKRPTDSTLQHKCWEMSVSEYEKGWLSKPTLAAQHDRINTILPPRFFIAEQHGNQEPKYRVVGDLAKSHVNLTVGASDTY